MWEMGVRSLGWEDPLEKGTATHSSTLACRITKDRGAWHATVPGVSESQTQLTNFHFTHSDWSDMILHSVILTRASLVAQLVKNLLVMQETPV